MTINNVIIYEVDRVLGSKDLYNISFVSTDSFTKMPFREIKSVFIPDTEPKFGDMFTIKDGKTWELKTPYKIHTYELATVLGKQNNDLLLCGNKIDEIKLINFSTKAHDNNAAFDIRRNDELLLNEYARGKFEILHNISQSQIKYLASLRVK